jgi:rod shape determining protein RodA
MTDFFRKFRYFDIPLQIAVFLQAFAGLALLYSTSVAAQGDTGIFWKQAVFLAIGLTAYFFFAFFDYHTLAKTNRVIYVVLVLVLVYILVFGSVVRGGRRWIDFSILRFQPAEFAKIVVILGLARLLYLKRGQINSAKRILWSFVYAVVPAGLILMEPDLGSAMVVVAIWAGILLISPIQKKYLIALFLIFLTLSGVTWKFFLKDFQRDRVAVFLNPGLDPQGRGYNVRQAIIAAGSGEFLGSGLGKGLQTEHKFLPEQQTDFIFASAAEEVGFLGTGALLFLYFYIFSRLLKICGKAKDDLGMYIAGGVFFMLLVHVLVNVGMNICLLPVTGITLPLLSAGGSSLIITLASLGIVQNIAIQSKALRF